jgi:hypothetical protein
MDGRSILVEASPIDFRPALPALSPAVEVCCTYCRGNHVVRLRRNLWERLTTPISGVYPFLCRFCHTKFYSPIQVRRNHESQ